LTVWVMLQVGWFGVRTLEWVNFAAQTPQVQLPFSPQLFAAINGLCVAAWLCALVAIFLRYKYFDRVTIAAMLLSQGLDWLIFVLNGRSDDATATAYFRLAINGAFALITIFLTLRAHRRTY